MLERHPLEWPEATSPNVRRTAQCPRGTGSAHRTARPAGGFTTHQSTFARGARAVPPHWATRQDEPVPPAPQSGIVRLGVRHAPAGSRTCRLAEPARPVRFSSPGCPSVRRPPRCLRRRGARPRPARLRARVPRRRPPPSSSGGRPMTARESVRDDRCSTGFRSVASGSRSSFVLRASRNTPVEAWPGWRSRCRAAHSGAPCGPWRPSSARRSSGTRPRSETRGARGGAQALALRTRRLPRRPPRPTRRRLA